MSIKPAIIAHRGVSSLALENTLTAFQMAHDMGADGIELDIHLSADNKIIVFHDYKTGRLSHENIEIATSTWDCISKITLKDNERIPLLEDVLNHFSSHFEWINIEIKSTGLRKTGLEMSLAELIKKYNSHCKYLVSSFNPFNLKRFKKLMPLTPLAYLIAKNEHPLLTHSKTIQSLKPRGLNIEADFDFFDEIQGKHPDLYKWIWTLDDVNHFLNWQSRPIEAIITNVPQKFLQNFK